MCGFRGKGRLFAALSCENFDGIGLSVKCEWDQYVEKKASG
jgi:hypothetical protein